MSFGVNFNNNKPIIKETQSMHDGGAGNLGYFEQEEEKKKKESDKSIFSQSKEGEDFFDKNGENEENKENFSISKLIAQVIFNIKNWFLGLFKSN